MKLLSLHQAPTRQQAMFFRHSWFGTAIALIVSLGVVAAIVKGYSAGKLPFFALLMAGIVSVFIVSMAASMLRRAFQPSNWILAFGPDRLWVKYRSYLNSHFPPDDLQIIELRFDEIESVGLIRRKEVAPGSRKGKQIQFFKYLEFVLRQPFGSVLSDALQAERSVKDNKNRKIRLRYGDYPVLVKEENAFRVRVNSIRPGWKGLLSELQRNGIIIAPEKRETEDYTIPLEDKRRVEDQLIALAERGRTLTAVKLARRHYGMNLTEAKRFIDELSTRRKET